MKPFQAFYCLWSLFCFFVFVSLLWVFLWLKCNQSSFFWGRSPAWSASCPPCQPVRAEGQAGADMDPAKADPKTCACSDEPPSVCIFFWHIFPRAPSFSRTLSGIWYFSLKEKGWGISWECRKNGLSNHKEGGIWKLMLLNFPPFGLSSVSTPHTAPSWRCATYTHTHTHKRACSEHHWAWIYSWKLSGFSQAKEAPSHRKGEI